MPPLLIRFRERPHPFWIGGSEMALVTDRTPAPRGGPVTEP
jgi:hypothetical protein